MTAALNWDFACIIFCSKYIRSEPWWTMPGIGCVSVYPRKKKSNLVGKKLGVPGYPSDKPNLGFKIFKENWEVQTKKPSLTYFLGGLLVHSFFRQIDPLKHDFQAKTPHWALECCGLDRAPTLTISMEENQTTLWVTSKKQMDKYGKESVMTKKNNQSRWSTWSAGWSCLRLSQRRKSGANSGLSCCHTAMWQPIYWMVTNSHITEAGFHVDHR